MDKWGLKFEKTRTVKHELCRRLRLTEATLNIEGQGVGIDPGVNFGITIINNGKALIYHGTLKKEEDPGKYGLVAYEFFQGAFAFVRGTCIIEGAAFGSKFGQPLLSEVRTGFYIAASLWANFSKVEIVPPATIRKRVFDHGNMNAADVWPVLENNGAAGLSMALYAVMKGK